MGVYAIVTTPEGYAITVCLPDQIWKGICAMNSKRKLKGAEIDLLTILGNIWKKKYIIILVTFVCALAMFLRAEFLLEPTYTASATMLCQQLQGNAGKR